MGSPDPWHRIQRGGQPVGLTSGRRRRFRSGDGLAGPSGIVRHGLCQPDDARAANRESHRRGSGCRCHQDRGRSGRNRTPPTRRTEITATMKLEELTDCASQFDRLFAEHFKPAAGAPVQELMGRHGNVIRYLITKSLAVDTEAAEQVAGHGQQHHHPHEARHGNHRRGDAGHAPPNLRTGYAAIRADARATGRRADLVPRRADQPPRAG